MVGPDATQVASTLDPAVGSLNLDLNSMADSIPSDIAVDDSNSEGTLNTIYFSNIVGKIFRVDFDEYDTDADSTKDTTKIYGGGLIADLSGGSRLFYNNIDNFLSSGFPVLKKIISEKSWNVMVRDFMVKHQSRSPLFNEMAYEFLTYLNNERESSSDPVFIKDLCHYEWVELALSTTDSQVCPINFDDQQDYLAIQIKTSPLAWPLSYPFPVHHISPEFQPSEPSEVPIFLLVYRNLDDEVLFLELNPMSAKLIDLLNEGKTGQQAAQQLWVII